jgi:hypothetical protein
VALAVFALGLSFVGISSAEQARSLATCYPRAANNPMYDGSAQGVGFARCESGSPCYLFDVRLVTSSGTVLSEWLNTQYPRCGFYGEYGWPTGNAYCKGRYIHTFFYINVGGTGKSHTSSTILCT